MLMPAYIERVRNDLADTDPAAYRWTDLELVNNINRAVSLYNLYSHLDLIIDAPTTPGSRIIDLSAGVAIVDTIVEVYHVEYPIGEYPPFMQQFSWFVTTLTIEMAEEGDGSDARLYCGMLHTVDDVVGNIPTLHEDIICQGATAFALYQKAIYAFDRVNIAGQATSSEFARLGKEYRDRFDLALSKLNRKLKRSRLFTPYALPVRTQQHVSLGLPMVDYTITATVMEGGET